jgi:protein tyrosine phosphatase domain-containing protein 1
MKEAVQCLCEGGRGCTREDPARQKDANAVPGLHSNWVGQHVLAMARPWQDNVVKFDLVNKFKELNIGMIINLQEVRSNSRCRLNRLISAGLDSSRGSSCNAQFLANGS